jgi:tetratricopeptide (TPR) repeat protein
VNLSIAWMVACLCSLTAAPLYHRYLFRRLKEYEAAGRLAMHGNDLGRAAELLSKSLKYGNAETPSLRPLTIAAMHNLGVALFRSGKFAEAAAHAEETVRLLALLEPHSSQMTNSLALLTQIYESLGRFEEPVTLRTWMLDFITEHPSLAGKLAAGNNDLGLAYMRMGDYERAQSYFETALDLERRNDGDPEKVSTFARMNLGALYERSGEFEQAEELWNEALSLRTSLGHVGERTARIRTNLAWLHCLQTRFDEAEGLARQALAELETGTGMERTRGSILHTLALVCTRTGRLDEADGLFIEVRQIRSALYVADHPTLLRLEGDIAMLRLVQGRPEEADDLLTAALKGLEDKLIPQHPDLAATRHRLGTLRAQQGRTTEARALLAAALETKKRLAPRHPETIECRKALEDLG